MVNSFSGCICLGWPSSSFRKYHDLLQTLMAIKISSEESAVILVRLSSYVTFTFFRGEFLLWLCLFDIMCASNIYMGVSFLNLDRCFVMILFVSLTWNYFPSSRLNK